MPAPEADLYAILGVPASASAEEIKQAYREQAKSAHPDAGGSVERMSELNGAYQTLSDPWARRQYDAARIMQAAAPEPRPHSSTHTATAQPVTHHDEPAQAEIHAAARRYVWYHLEQFAWVAGLGGLALSYLSTQSALSDSSFALGFFGFGALYWLLLQLVYLAVPELKISNYQTARAPWRADRQGLVRLAACTLAWIPLGLVWPFILRLWLAGS